MHIQKRSLRFGLVFFSLIFLLLVFSFRLTLIQIFRSDHLVKLAEKQQNHYIKLEPVRGTIYDRNMRPLAINVAVYSLYANPKIMDKEDKEKAVKELSRLLDLDQTILQDRLDRPKYFVWLKRKLSSDGTDQIRKLKIKGLDFIKESKRHYPNKYLASHLIGFAGVDNQGLEGLELLYNKELSGKAGWVHVLRDARQRELLLEKSFIPPKDGFNIVLTIDETIQYIAERALDEAFEKYHAHGASIIVMNPKTGEILALANRPTYDLENFRNSIPEQKTDRAIVNVYEPGSVFKIVTLSAALEEGIAKETDVFFCENGAYKVGNHILHDHHPYGNLTLKQVIEESSNICTTKIAQKMGPQTFYKYAKRYRFGMKTGIDIVGEVSGLLKDPSQWSSTSIGAIPIGQEVTVTPLQLVAAISSIADGGVYMKPHVVKYILDNHEELIKEYQPQVVDRVISSDTARRVKDVLVGVVQEGTGRLARVDGLKIAGKTGTAQKVVDGRYSRSHFCATFIGFAPADDPQLAMVVTFDDPRGSHYGGTVSAPVFKKVLVDSLKYLEAVDGTKVSWK